LVLVNLGQCFSTKCLLSKALGWSDALISQTHLTDKAKELTDNPAIELIIEATGNNLVGLLHAQDAIKAKQHVVMVNVEADVLAGARLAKMAQEAGVVYSMAYGDQPALVAEMVDWGRALGFEIASAGKCTKYMPHFHYVTPAKVWEHYGSTP
jgi:predicted homoserine dehydrogenase-like protein